MRNLVKRLLEKADARHLFWVSFGFFVLDNVVNNFMYVPLFVTYGLALLPVLGAYLVWKKGFTKTSALLTGLLVLSFLVGVLRFGFSVKNLSDLVFVLLFVLSWLFYKMHGPLPASSVIGFFGVCALLFSTTFFGIERFVYSQDKAVQREMNERQRQKAKKEGVYFEQHEDKAKKELYKKDPMKLSEQWNLSLEVFREYRKGLFRVPHVASYFFGFIAFYLIGFWFREKQKWWALLLAGISLGFCLYTGSRTILFAFVPAVFVFFLFSKKYRPYVLVLAGGAGLFLYFLKPIMQLFQNTFLFQHLVTINTLLKNPGQFSRFKIWGSWWQEVQGFGAVDWLFGRTHLSGMEANFRNLKTSIWFHNDFLNVSYAYGFVALAVLLFFWREMYLACKGGIREHFLGFTLFFTMLFAALMNGFYYYFPLFILPVFMAVWMKGEAKTPVA